MNDDELEKRLARWQPAPPPADLMRRLRAAEPILRPNASWRAVFGLLCQGTRPFAWAGLLISAALAFWHSAPAPVARPASRAQTPARDIAPSRNGTTTFELGAFAVPARMYAALDVRLTTRSGSDFQLDAPPGPMRLDCVSILSRSLLDSSFLDNNNTNDPF